MSAPDPELFVLVDCHAPGAAAAFIPEPAVDKTTTSDLDMAVKVTREEARRWEAKNPTDRALHYAAACACSIRAVPKTAAVHGPGIMVVQVAEWMPSTIVALARPLAALIGGLSSEQRTLLIGKLTALLATATPTTAAAIRLAMVVLRENGAVL